MLRVDVDIDQFAKSDLVRRSIVDLRCVTLIVLKTALGERCKAALYDKVGTCDIDVARQVVDVTATTWVWVSTRQSIRQVVEIEISILFEGAAENFCSRWDGPSQSARGRVRAKRVIFFMVKITDVTYQKLGASQKQIVESACT